MTAVILPWLKFAVCAALIGVAGPVLTRYADIIARLTGLSRTWIGLLLLADDRRAPDDLHYAYGSLSLAVALAPWFYAPGTGPRRLLWFAATTGVAGALATRAFMTGSA